MFQRKMQVPLSLYLHFPWCLRKCPYCDFNAHRYPMGVDIQALVTAYLQALNQDLQYASQALEESAASPIQTIFIGGGTPSLLTGTQLATLLEQVQRCFSVAAGAEITLEANPLTINVAKAKQFLQAGINRISLGVQSFNESSLQKLGRQHRAGQAEASVKLLQDAGLTNLNLDIIYALPDQSVAEALTDLQQALALQPTHLSWYQLTLNRHQQHDLARRGAKYFLSADEITSIEAAGRQLLQADYQFERYEISAYAASSQWRSAHNLNYWSYGDYLGVGAGACGKLTRVDGLVCRWQQIAEPQLYIRQMLTEAEKMANATAKVEWIEPSAQELEFMLNAGRLLCPIPYSWFSQRTSGDEQIWRAKLTTLAERQLIRLHKNSFQITPLGSDLLDSWLVEFGG